ncbi:restriction endonuclease [Rhodanobacter soli]|uniref:restriction endonuclease n=1 Tax=Rhodanobacter soli TaxID=590609 RepID=UPI0031DDEF39
MAKRTKGGFEQIAAMPWWLGILIGLIGYVAIRHGIGWYLASFDNPVLHGLGNVATSGIYAPLAWMLLIGCWLAALASFLGRGRRRQLLDNQTGIDSLRQMNWRQFEQLTGEAFHRQGYAIEETGLGGADGGIDLILHKNSQTTLVQCKQWQNRQVGVKVVREMYGLLVHHQAAAVKIVALGDYTPDAHRFAQGKPIELIHGGELIATVRKLQTGKARATHPLDTPLAFGGSIAASLLLIAGLSPSTASTSQARPIPVPPAAFQSALRPEPPSIPHRYTASTPRAQSVIYASDSQDDAELREWKKRNAEAMKILEKTTKEMPLH